MKIPKFPPRIRCFDLMPVVAAVVVLSIAGGSVIAQQPPALQPIDWVLGANTQLTTNPGGIKRPTGGSAAWNAGAISSQRILRDGRLEFKASPGCQAMLGLSVDSVSDASAEIDYAIYLIPSGTSLTSGTAQIYQNTSVAATANTAGASLGSYTSTTVFAIRRIGSQVQYLKDGIVMGTATVPSAGMLLVDSSFYKQGSTITSAHVYTGDLDEDGMPDAWEKSYLPPDHGWNDVVKFTWDGHADADGVTNRMEFEDGSDPTDALSCLAPVSWGSRVKTTAVGTDGGLQRDNSAVGWTADAVSGADIPEDGKVVFRVPLGSYLSVGLTYANNDRLTTDLEYRIVVKNTNQAEFVRPESATAVTMGSYTADTVFAIQRVNSKVQFLKDGVVMGTSTTPLSSGPLIVDCSLYGVSTQIAMCRLYTGDLDNDEMPDAWELSYLPANAGYAQLDAFKPTGSTSDPDDDGIQNLHEYYDGTHPFRKLLQPASILWQPAPANYLSVIGTQGGVKKISTIAGWNADAVASKLDTNNTVVPLIMGQTGRLSFKANPGSSLAMGFTAANGYRTQNDLEYMIQLTSASPGQASVYEGTGSTTAATLKDALGTYDADTHFSIRRVARQIDYFKNGQLFHSSLVPAYLPLLVDSSFNAANSEITSARLYTGDVDGDELPDDWEIDLYQRQHNGSVPTFAQLQAFAFDGNADGDNFTNRQEYRHGSDPLQQTSVPTAITWGSFAGTTNQPVVAGGYLRKTGTTAGFNADATSAESLTGDGVMSFTVAPGILAVGLTTTAGASNTNNADTDLRYAFVLSATDAKVQRPDSATDLSVGAYTASTVFAIRRTGGVIEFLKDGLVVETSITPSAGTVYADCSLSAVGTQITSAYLNDGDLDNDGLPDAWELQYLALNATLAQLVALQPNADQENNGAGDGLTLAQEYLHGTSDLLADTDADGMSDLWEIQHGLAVLNPSNANVDADSDGLANLAEFLQGTLPLVWDTDGDGIPDGYEVNSGLLPLDAGDGLADTDGDLVPNLWEYGRGTLANNAASLPAWDAIVQPNGLDIPSQKLFNSLAAAYESLPTDPSYRATIKILRGSHANALLPNNFLQAVPQVPRTVAFIAEGGAQRLNGSQGGAEGVVFLRSGLAPMLVTGESFFSGVIFDGGAGVSVEPAVNSAPAVTFINCVFRNVQQGQGIVNGSVLNNEGGKVVFEHCTLFRCYTNVVGYYGPSIANLGGTIRVKNSIIWSDLHPVTPISSSVAGAVTIESSLVQGGMFGSLNQHPHLTAKGYLTVGSSACFAAGGATRLFVDLHGQTRPWSSPTLGAVQWINGDNDSLPDWWERWWFADTSLSDNSRTNPDHSALTLLNAYMDEDWNPVPLLDRDGDGLHDPWELGHWGDLSVQNATGDADNDGINNLNELLAGSNPTRYPGDEDTDGDGLTDVQEQALGTNQTLADTDEDGLSDGWEVASAYNALIATDGTQDLDRDGVNAADEVEQGTYDNNVDSDSDGLDDGEDAVPYDHAFDVPRSAVSNLIPIDLGVCTRDNSLLIAKDGSCVWRISDLHPPVYKVWTPGRGLEQIVGLDPTTPNGPNELRITDIAEGGVLLGATLLDGAGPSGRQYIGVSWNLSSGQSNRYQAAPYLGWDDNHIVGLMKGPKNTVIATVNLSNGNSNVPDSDFPDTNGFNPIWPQAEMWFNNGTVFFTRGYRDQCPYPGSVKKIDPVTGNSMWSMTHANMRWPSQEVFAYRFGGLIQEEVYYTSTWSQWLHELSPGQNVYSRTHLVDGYEYKRWFNLDPLGSTSYFIDQGVQFVWQTVENPWAGTHYVIRDVSDYIDGSQKPYLAGDRMRLIDRDDQDLGPPRGLLPEAKYLEAILESTGAYIWTQGVNGWRPIYTKGGPGKQQLGRIRFVNRSAQAIVSEGAAWSAPLKLWANGKVHDISTLLPTNFASQWSNLDVRSLTSSGAIIATATSSVDGLTHLLNLLPIDLTAHKRGTIDAPGTAIARPGGSEVYEVVTLENADYDETNWQPTSMSDGAQEDKQDGKTDVVSKDKDDDFVKLRFSCPLTNVAGSSEIVFDQAGTGERMQDADIRFYNSAGDRVQRSALKIDNLKSPSGPLAPAFAGGLDLFVEIGDLGEITGQSAQADDITRKYADLIWKITAGGTTIEQKVRIYRGGFWRADRSDNTGTIAFYDGKGRKSDGAVDYGQIVKGPYQIKTGQEGQPDETIPNTGPTPIGWYGLYARNRGNNNIDMRTWWDGNSRPQTNHHYGPGQSQQALGYVQQGSYCQWAQSGNHNIPGKGAYGYDNGNNSDPYQGMPASIHFKFQLVEIGNFTTRSELQIHPDGFCDGTAGCVGIQTYDDCCKVLFLVRHYFQSRLLVD